MDFAVSLESRKNGLAVEPTKEFLAVGSTTLKPLSPMKDSVELVGLPNRYFHVVKYSRPYM